MAFYRLKKDAGQHTQGGKTYNSGDVVETEMNLIEKFAGKFELLHEEDSQDTGVTVPSIMTPAGEGEDDAKASSEPSPGKSSKKKSKKTAPTKSTPVEVTSEYPDAVDIGVQVFKKSKSNGDWFFVTDPDDNDAQMHEKLLREKDVTPFIESITEEDEE
jgi:hypothetical protein